MGYDFAHDLNCPGVGFGGPGGGFGGPGDGFGGPGFQEFSNKFQGNFQD